MVKITLLNGPPRAGKDTLAKLLCDQAAGDMILSFADPLKVATHAALGLFGTTGKPLPANAFESVKDDTNVQGFHGVSPRQAYIQMSEGFSKPLWGPAYFGERFADLVRALRPGVEHHVIVPDCGFVAEAEAIVDRFGAERVRLFQIHRDGCDFSKDSRSFVDLSHVGVEPRIVDNSGSLLDLRRIATSINESWT